MSVVINPEEYFVWLNKQLWPGIGPLALLQSQFPVISCSHTAPAAIGKSQGKCQILWTRSKSGTNHRVGLRKGRWINKPGTWLEKPWVFQQTAVKLVLRLHLHKL